MKAGPFVETSDIDYSQKGLNSNWGTCVHACTVYKSCESRIGYGTLTWFDNSLTKWFCIDI